LTIIRSKKSFKFTSYSVGFVIAAVFLSFILSACAVVGPDFKRSDVNVPAQWNGANQKNISQTVNDKDLTNWWKVFNDPALNSLEERAASSNLDLKLAEARIRQARATRAIAAGGLGPTVSASGSYRKSESPSNIRGNTTEVTSSQYQAGFDASWEMDIFGGQRRNLEAAEADLLTSVESRHNVIVTLMAEVASNYIQLRGYQQQIVITKQNLEAQQHSSKLTHERFEGGFVSGLDVANAEAQTATTSAQIPLLESSAIQTIYSLSILLSEAPAALSAELSPAGEIPVAPPAVPAGVPSELLRRRPDIRMAEAGIHAATARIGVAESALYPTFTITGALGLQSNNSGSLLDWSNRFWSLGPSVLFNLFNSGKVKAGVEVQKALQEEAVITYQQTVLNALQEVEKALVASGKEQTRRSDLVTAVAANKKAVSLALTMYTDGLTDFSNVLLSQQALFNTENSLVQSTANLSNDLVALYKALGGGWAEEPLKQQATPQPVSSK
jgi:outer membrane protein, multidrug efflux system